MLSIKCFPSNTMELRKTSTRKISSEPTLSGTSELQREAKKQPKNHHSYPGYITSDWGMGKTSGKDDTTRSTPIRSHFPETSVPHRKKEEGMFLPFPCCSHAHNNSGNNDTDQNPRKKASDNDHGRRRVCARRRARSGPVVCRR